MKNETSDIVIYKPKGKAPSLEVRLDKETVWLNAHQIASLLDVKRPAIVKHINNIYRTGELREKSTCSILEHVAADGKKRKMKFYSLDMIISVGYRVNSKMATQFRIWATNILKDHLVKGYTINEKRLKEHARSLDELTRSIDILQKVTGNYPLSPDQTQGILQVISDFAYGLKTLDDFDQRDLAIQATQEKVKFILDYKTARKSIDEMANQLKKAEGGIFGIEKDDSLQGSLKAIHQTIDGQDAYPSVEEKADHLLYFIVKNHPFVDGNKRIGASLFLWFLERNGILYREDGTKRVADNALVALTLMVAESKPTEKDLIVKVITNLINRNN